EATANSAETADPAVAVGRKVPVKIIEIDGDRRRISLSIRQALPGGGAEPLPDDEITPAAEWWPAEEPARAAEAAPARDVLEAAMAPEVEPAATPEPDAAA